jgi:hypothetical protein
MSDQKNTVEVIETYPNGQVKDQCTTVPLDGVNWQVVESFDEQGKRTQLMQISPPPVSKVVREIKYDNGIASSIFLPATTAKYADVRLTLKPDRMPDTIQVGDKKDSRRGTFIGTDQIDMGTLKIVPAGSEHLEITAGFDFVEPLSTRPFNLAPSDIPPEKLLGLGGNGGRADLLNVGTSMSQRGELRNIRRELEGEEKRLKSELAALGVDLTSRSAQPANEEPKTLKPSDIIAAGKKPASAVTAQKSYLSLYDQTGDGAVIRGDLARAYMPLPGIDMGIPESPNPFRAVTLWPNGAVKSAMAVSRAGYKQELRFDENRKLTMTKTYEPNQIMYRAITAYDLNKMVNSDVIIETPEGALQAYAHNYPSGKPHFIMAFYKGNETFPMMVRFQEFDEKNDKPKLSVEGVPVLATDKQAESLNLTPEQKRAMSITRYLMEVEFSPLKTAFHPEMDTTLEHPKSERIHPTKQVQSIWKAPADATCDSHHTVFNGVPAETQHWKDKAGNTLHIRELKPNRQILSEIWYKDGKPSQVDYYGPAQDRILTVILGENARTMAMITWKQASKYPQEIYRFDIHPDMMQVESYHEKRNELNHTFNIAMQDAMERMPMMTHAAYAHAMSPRSYETGLPSYEYSTILDTHETGAIRLASFNEADGTKPVSEYSTHGSIVREFLLQPHSHKLREFKNGDAVTSEYVHDFNQKTKTLKLYLPDQSRSEEKPLLHFKLDISEKKGTFSLREYEKKGGKANVIAEAKDVPVAYLGKDIPKEYLPHNKTEWNTQFLSDAITAAEHTLDHHLHPATVTRQFNQRNERVYTFTPSGSAKSSVRTEILRTDRTPREVREAKPDGSGTYTYYWKDNERGNIPRCVLTHSAVPHEQSHARIYMQTLTAKEEEAIVNKLKPHKPSADDFKPTVEDRIIEDAREDAKAIMAANPHDIILDFHGIEKLQAVHREVIEDIYQLLNEELREGGREGKELTRRKLRITGIDTKDPVKKAGLEREIKAALPDIEILPNQFSRSPEMPYVTLTSRTEHNPRGQKVFEERFHPETGEHQSFEAFDPKTNRPVKGAAYVPFINEDVPARAQAVGKK